jgi:hypothetical protein
MIVREDTRHRREVADVAVDHSEEGDDRGLVRGDAVEIAHHATAGRPEEARSKRLLIISFICLVDLTTRKCFLRCSKEYSESNGTIAAFVNDDVAVVIPGFAGESIGFLTRIGRPLGRCPNRAAVDGLS